MMGARNVSLAYMYWRRLPDRAFRLLAFMALISMDDAVPPVYWGGQDGLATALGKSGSSGQKAVRESLLQLKSAGCVGLAVHSAPGRQAEYSLHLLPNRYVSDSCEQQVTIPDRSVSDGCEQSPRVGNTSVSDSSDNGAIRATLEDETPQHRRMRRRTLEDETPNTAVSDSPRGTTRNNKENERNNLPLVSTSPATALSYEQASKLLQRLPDLGAALLALTPEGQPYTERVVAAALLASGGVPA